ncbi:MAG: hypothetical protein KF752_03555 [Pirellulaceae bacterium]|nr:hypothetical protein [Pirellulaceae bacterium]
METSLHQQLKLLYARDASQTEVVIGGFRIDAIAASGELVEIQHGSLAQLRDKTRRLLSPGSQHRLRIVKPLVARKRVTTLIKRDGPVQRSRMSPKSCDWLDVFVELVYFTSAFPHKRLTLDVLLIEAEEFRVDRQRRRHRGKNYCTLDIQMNEVVQSIELRTIGDLLNRLPFDELANPFNTAQLAVAVGRPRWLAQKIAYSLRLMGGLQCVGRNRHGQLYQLPRKYQRTVLDAAG